MTLQLLHSELYEYEKNFILFFYQCGDNCGWFSSRAMHEGSLTAQRQNPHSGESQNKGLQVCVQSFL
jgi:hypothetical protein